MKILSVETIVEILNKHGLEKFMTDLILKLRGDFSRWSEFNKMPRPAMHVPGGVLELMPVCDSQFYTFKYVNCHPKNPETDLMTVVATGQLSRIDTGYPLMFSEMTLLTALRTACTTALATDLLARQDSRVHTIIGTGAQSEFLVKAIALVRDIAEVRYFDTDPHAMDKFAENMKGVKFKLTRAETAEEACRGADIITTCTACKAHVDVIQNEWIREGVHINGIGGDCQGKTELEFAILDRSKIVVEYFDQSIIEGEIQHYSKDIARLKVHAELHEIINSQKNSRANEREITLYDSVGIGLEDFSVLTFMHELAEKYFLGVEVQIIPEIKNPKNLFSLLQ